MSTPPLKQKMAIIDEAALTTMALNPAIAKEFPVLKPVAKLARSGGRGSCGGCGRAAQERSRLFAQVKLALAGMDATRKRKLKDLLNARSVRLMYKDTRGKAQQLTF